MCAYFLCKFSAIQLLSRDELIPVEASNKLRENPDCMENTFYYLITANHDKLQNVFAQIVFFAALILGGEKQRYYIALITILSTPNKYDPYVGLINAWMQLYFNSNEINCRKRRFKIKRNIYYVWLSRALILMMHKKHACHKKRTVGMIGKLWCEMIDLMELMRINKAVSARSSFLIHRMNTQRK